MLIKSKNLIQTISVKIGELFYFAFVYYFKIDGL